MGKGRIYGYLIIDSEGNVRKDCKTYLFIEGPYKSKSCCTKECH